VCPYGWRLGRRCVGITAVREKIVTNGDRSGNSPSIENTSSFGSSGGTLEGLWLPFGRRKILLGVSLAALALFVAQRRGLENCKKIL